LRNRKVAYGRRTYRKNPKGRTKVGPASINAKVRDCTREKTVEGFCGKKLAAYTQPSEMPTRWGKTVGLS